jgi:hypothetical protein
MVRKLILKQQTEADCGELEIGENKCAQQIYTNFIQRIDVVTAQQGARPLLLCESDG